MSRIVYISLPNIASFLSLWILNLANCHFTEKYQKEDELSAYAISYMWGKFLFIINKKIYFILYLNI